MSHPRQAASLAARSIHLRIVPRPANLSESREMLRVLQRFGEVSMYKSLRYEYHNPAENIALAIFRDARSAQNALDASPIRFELERGGSRDDVEGESEGEAEVEEESGAEKRPSNSSIEEILRPSTLSVSARSYPSPSPASSQPPPFPFAEPPLQSRPASKKPFQISVDRSRAVHQDFIERQPFWKQFHPMRSLAQEDLAKVVPLQGLSDVKKRMGDQYRTPVKVLRGMSEYVERWMPSLRGLVGDSGGRERERERG